MYWVIYVPIMEDAICGARHCHSTPGAALGLQKGPCRAETHGACMACSCPWAASLCHTLAGYDPAWVEPDPLATSRLHGPCTLHAAATLQAAVGSTPLAPQLLRLYRGPTARTTGHAQTPLSRPDMTDRLCRRRTKPSPAETATEKETRAKQPDSPTHPESRGILTVEVTQAKSLEVGKP